MDAGTNSGKQEVDSMIFGRAWSKMAMYNQLYLTNEFMNWADFLNVGNA